MQEGVHICSVLLQRMGSMAFISLSKGCDPKGLRITRVNFTSNGQESIFLSERSKLMPRASAYQESEEGHARPTEVD